MLAYDISAILSLVPAAGEMVKKASIEEDFPANNKDSVCASYLRIGYLTKVAGKEVDQDIKERIVKAACLYGVKNKLDELSIAFNPSMEKSASEIQGELMTEFEYSFGMFPDIEKTASLADKLYEMGSTDDRVKAYSGHTYMNKEAAVLALVNRYHATQDETFVKIARVVHDNVKINDFESIHDICQTVTSMDKKAGLDVIGFNIYNEALFTKSAAAVQGLTISLAGESFPIEKIQRLGKDRIGSLLGDEVAKDFGSDLVENKYMLEALPRDQQMVLKTALKNV